MMHRYFIIEPLYSDLDTFCNFTVGTGRVRANIQIYANHDMLVDVVMALSAPELTREFPECDVQDLIFDFRVSVMPHGKDGRTVRFQVFQKDMDEGASFMSDIHFHVSTQQSLEFARDLDAWLKSKDYPLEWKP